jgi:formylglycine-generating enzyme required for sulfatase activity
MSKADASTITVVAGGEAMKFIRISPSDHKIQYPNFYMLETEVTNKQFLAYLRQTGHTKDDVDVLKAIEEREHAWNTKEEVQPDGSITITMEATIPTSTAGIPYRIEDPTAIWRNGSYPGGLDDHPVALVTVDDAKAFCDWLNKSFPQDGLFRLPTWNEWMIAAYGSDRAYPWGNDWNPSNVHMSIGAKAKRTEPVKARPQGKTPEALFGMLGNVSEFITESDPTNENYVDLGSRWMGGGFIEGPEDDDANRRLEPRSDYWGYSHHMSIRQCDLGFRVVLDPRRDLSLVSRDRVFEQKNRAWMIEPDRSSPKPSPEPRLP